MTKIKLCFLLLSLFFLSKEDNFDKPIIMW